jgi:hypothetical protein
LADRHFLPSELRPFLRATFLQFRRETSQENRRPAEITSKDCPGDHRSELATALKGPGEKSNFIFLVLTTFGSFWMKLENLCLHKNIFYGLKQII